MQIVKESWKRLWNAEEIRILVLASLGFQFGLVFFSPLRKRTSQRLLILLIWLFYLVADYVAVLALGNLLKRQNETADINHSRPSNDLMAFWAPFLLLHLGGPDTITSYSIEDNELWWRHFLGLAVQVGVAFLVLLELAAVPRLRVPAALIFIAGLVKYSERTWSLRSASMDQLRDSMVRKPDPGPDYAEFMETYVWRREAGQSAYTKRKNEPPPTAIISTSTSTSTDTGTSNSNPDGTPPGNKIYDKHLILKAYKLYKQFKPVVVDLMLSFQERQDSQKYFWESNVSQAFKVVEIELSFLYDIFHTKRILIWSLRGCLWRLISLGMISFAFLLFLMSDKRGYTKPDIIISYVLLGSALFMELVSLLLIMISDWMIVALKKHSQEKLADVITKAMSCFFPKGKRRWSNSMLQFSLLTYSREDKKTIFNQILGMIKKVKEMWDNFWFTFSVRVPPKLEELFFEELKTKSMNARNTSDFKELRDCKGEKVLELEKYDHLRWSIDKEFDESILLWHIATDLCFHTDTDSPPYQNIETGHDRNDKNSNPYSEISLVMSNYLLYLLIMQPSMMPAGIGKIRFQDTCDEAKNFFRREERGLTKAQARESLMDVETEVDPAEVKGDRSKSVLFDACRLAKELNLLAEDERWQVISKVWVEMLGYAAISCKTYFHAKQLSMGGEFLTHIWLLMAHMGIGEQYRIEAGHAVAKLAFNN
ncbi:uncharacterized protein LOC144557652 [Carex rostrata]